MPESFSNNPCNLFYFVHLSSSGAPIPGTMFSKNNNKLDPGLTRANETRLPLTQMQVPAGFLQSFPKNGLRYYYRTYNDGGTLRILPNSMFSQLGRPSDMCNILEFKILCCN